MPTLHLLEGDLPISDVDIPRLIDAVHRNDSGGRDIAARLQGTAMALRRVGLDRVAEEIEQEVSNILYFTTIVSRAYSKDLNEVLVNAQENSINIVHACLAGLELGRNER